MSVGRRRIRGTSITCIHSLLFKLVVVVTNTIPQVDKVRRLSVHWTYYVSLYIISLSLSLSLPLCLCLYVLCLCTYMFMLRVFICMAFMYIIGSYMKFCLQ